MTAKVVRDKRIASRKRRIIFRKFSIFLWVLLGLAIFTGTIFGLNFFYNSQYFKIKTINIKNNKYYKNDEILAFLEPLIGQNIFEINKKETEDSLETEYKRIKKAELKKIFPDNLEISVTERQPCLKLNYKDKVFLIDEDGVVIEDISLMQSGYTSLILVKDAINYLPEVGSKIAKKSILSIARIYDSMPEEIRSKIGSAGISDDIFNDIFFTTVSNIVILYGNTSELIKKNLIIEQILKEIEYEDEYYSIIDVRITDSPMLR